LPDYVLASVCMIPLPASAKRPVLLACYHGRNKSATRTRGRALGIDSYPRGKTEKINVRFNYPLSETLVGARIANKGVIEAQAGFEAFFGYKFLPNFTNFYQKRAANGLEHGPKRGFFATDLLKRCQVPRLVSTRNRQFATLFSNVAEERTESLRLLPVKRRMRLGAVGGTEDQPGRVSNFELRVSKRM